MADKYTYADVIIDPNDPRVEIGKDYYFALGAQACIDYANIGKKLNTLDEIDKSGQYHPFITDEKDYPFIIRKKEPSYLERQNVWVQENGIKSHDRVKILEGCDDYKNGWNNRWYPEMNETIGETYTIQKISGYDGLLLSNGWYYPYFALEKAEKKYVPLDLNDREDVFNLMGSWLMNKTSGSYHCVITIKPAKNLVYIDGFGEMSPEELLEGFMFVFNNSPCGKLVEEE